MKEITTSLCQSIGERTTVKIYFVNPNYKTDEDKYRVAKLNIDDSVVKELKNLVRGSLEEIQDRNQIPIERIDKDDEDYVLTINLDDVENLKNYIGQIDREEYVTFNAHDSEDYLEKLKFYIVEIEFEDEKHYFIKRYSKSKLLVPKQVFLFCKQNTFEHLEGTEMLVLEKEFDAFVSKGTIFAIKEKQFSLLTGYYEKEKAYTNKILDEVNNIGLIDDFDALREHCLDKISYVKRLSKVDENTLGKISFEKIVELRDTRGTDFLIDYDRKKVSFMNKEQLKNLVDLILDNFMTSVITGEQYRAVNKMKELAI